MPPRVGGLFLLRVVARLSSVTFLLYKFVPTMPYSLLHRMTHSALFDARNDAHQGV